MTWALGLWPPLAFLLVIAGASVLEVRRGAQSGDEIGAAVQAKVSVLLSVTLAVVGLSAIAVVVLDAERRAGLAGSIAGESWATASGWGALAGVAIAGIYFGGLDRAIAAAQARFGDYVPAGSTAALGADRRAFFVANVILAPLVEEVWYRGLLFNALGLEVGGVAAAALGCAAFGLFHWPGGAWYVLVTGVLVGVPCWVLRHTFGGLAGPFAAHLTLNVLEYVILTQRASRRPRGR